MYVGDAEIMLEPGPVVFVVFICSAPFIVDEIVVLPDDLPDRMASAGIKVAVRVTAHLPVKESDELGQ